MYAVKIYGILQAKSLGYISHIFSVSSSMALSLFSIMIAIGVLISAVRIVSGSITWKSGFSLMMGVGIVGALLSVFQSSVGFEFFFNFFYFIVKEITGIVSQNLLNSSNALGKLTSDFEYTISVGAGANDPLFKLMYVTEGKIREIWNFMMGVADLTSWYKFYLYLFALIVTAPYIYVLVLYTAYVISYVFKITAISVLFPFGVALAATPNTRKYLKQMVAVVAQGALTVIIASVAMGFTLYIFAEYTNGINPFSESMSAKDAEEFLTSGECFGIMIFGFVSIIFHMKAPLMASSIIGVSDSGSVEGLVSAIGMGAVGYGKHLLGRAAGYSAKGMFWVGKAAAPHAVDMLKNSYQTLKQGNFITPKGDK